MSGAFTESDVESTALAWLESLGWTVRHGPEIAPGELFAERQDYREVVLEHRLRDALVRLNPDLPTEALEDAFRRITHPEGATLEARNRASGAPDQEAVAARAAQLDSPEPAAGVPGPGRWLGEARPLPGNPDAWLALGWNREKIVKELLVERLEAIRYLGGYKSKGMGRVRITVRPQEG